MCFSYLVNKELAPEACGTGINQLEGRGTVSKDRNIRGNTREVSVVILGTHPTLQLQA